MDNFVSDLPALWAAVPKLRVPLIITVRHPAEGGANGLSLARRRELDNRFLPHASLLDLELRSFDPLADIVAAARSAGVKLIASAHHFRSTPPTAALQQAIRRAYRAGADLCKLAAQTATPAALGRLLTLLTRPQPLPLSVMGMGQFGKISRLVLAQAGSILNYGYLDRPNASGQWEARLLKQRLAELE